MFGSRPENETPKNEKLNSKFTLIGPMTRAKALRFLELLQIHYLNWVGIHSGENQNNFTMLGIIGMIRLIWLNWLATFDSEGRETLSKDSEISRDGYICMYVSL